MEPAGSARGHGQYRYGGRKGGGDQGRTQQAGKCRPESGVPATFASVWFASDRQPAAISRYRTSQACAGRARSAHAKRVKIRYARSAGCGFAHVRFTAGGLGLPA